MNAKRNLVAAIERLLGSLPPVQWGHRIGLTVKDGTLHDVRRAAAEMGRPAGDVYSVAIPDEAIEAALEGSAPSFDAMVDRLNANANLDASGGDPEALEAFVREEARAQGSRVLAWSRSEGAWIIVKPSRSSNAWTTDIVGPSPGAWDEYPDDDLSHFVGLPPSPEKEA